MNFKIGSASSPTFGLKISPEMKFLITYNVKKFFSEKETKQILKMLKNTQSSYSNLGNFRLRKLNYNQTVYCDIFMFSENHKKSELISTPIGRFKQDPFPFEKIKKLIMS